MTARDDAIEAGAQALHGDECPDDEHDLCDVGAWDRAAAAVVDAVEPIIRERIAQAIEEQADDFGFDEIVRAMDDLNALRDVVKDALHAAAGIARGGESDE